MKVAIVHYWLVQMRGGEKVLEAICKIYPDADIYTHVVDRENISKEILSHKIYTTWIAKLPGAKKHYQKYLPLMPYALESIDLTSYDLIISSESGPAKGVIPPPEATHICYCHSPMRYIWDQYWTYRKNAGIAEKIFLSLLGRSLREWDAISAQRVDLFIANSNFVAHRINKYYRRTSIVIPPPVEFKCRTLTPKTRFKKPFYLWVGELTSYKRPDVAVEAFNLNGKHLIIVGRGAEKKKLQKLAKGNIEFKECVSDEELASHYSECEALIYPGIEDFRIIPLEANYHGSPVIAFGGGGALDSQIPGKTAIFFQEQTALGLAAAIDNFENVKGALLTRSQLIQHAKRFNQNEFIRQFRSAVENYQSESGVGKQDAC